MFQHARKRRFSPLLAISYLVVSCLALAPTESIARDASQNVDWTPIALVPIQGDFFLGAPNLKLLKALTGPNEKMGVKLYTEPSIFTARLDEESARIVAELETLLTLEFRNRGFGVHRPSEGAISADETSSLHASFFAAVSAQAVTVHEAIVGAATIANAAGVDALLIARFWGWRKGSLSLPVMGYTQSAAQLWLGLVDGKSGELVWHGSSTKATHITVSKQEIKQLDKLMRDALRSLNLENAN